MIAPQYGSVSLAGKSRWVASHQVEASRRVKFHHIQVNVSTRQKGNIAQHCNKTL